MATAKAVRRVEEIMSTHPVCVTPTTSLEDVCRTLEENEISGLPVVDSGGRVVGVISKTDLIQALGRPRRGSAPAYLFERLREEEDEELEDMYDEEDMSVQDLMSDDVVTAEPAEPVWMVARRMAEERVHRVIVIDPNRVPIGVVTSLDVLQSFPGG